MGKIRITVVTPSIRPEGLKIVQESLAKQTLKDFEWLQEIGIPGLGHDLNSAYNRMLRRAQGELIVSIQDYIKLPPDYLQRFWDAYQKDKQTFYTSPVGKVDNLEYQGPIKWDWRAFTDATITFRSWEIDSACAPLAALKEIGGFDEEMDGYWSSDNVFVGFRAEKAGYKIANLFDNPVLAYDHDAHMPHPFRDNFYPTIAADRIEAYRNGLTLHYL